MKYDYGFIFALAYIMITCKPSGLKSLSSRQHIMPQSQKWNQRLADEYFLKSLVGAGGIWRAPTSKPANFYSPEGHLGLAGSIQLRILGALAFFFQGKQSKFLGGASADHPQTPPDALQMLGRCSSRKKHPQGIHQALTGHQGASSRCLERHQ